MATVRALTSFATSEHSVDVGKEYDHADPIVLRFPTLFTEPPEAPKAEKPARTVKKAAPKADG